MSSSALVFRRRSGYNLTPKRSFLDRALNYLGYSKRTSNTVFSGAQGTRLTLDWIASILSADQEMRGNLRVMRARARELSRNNPIAKNYLNLLVANVVGHKGIGYIPQVRNNDGTLADPINKKITAAFVEWSKKENCSVDGKLSFREIQELTLQNCATDGDVFIRKVRGYDNPFGFALQLFDADQVDHLYNIPPAKGVNEIRMGVEVNTWGRPIAYHVTLQHPSDLGGSLERTRIPAEDIIHLYRPDRISQSRGITWFHAVMLELRMLGGYIEAELVAARTGASKMGWLEHIETDSYEAPNEDVKFTFDANPGTIETLPPGMKFTAWNPDHPSGAFPNFVITILRMVATGLGVSYNALASDLVGVNYSSMRSGLLVERDQWKRTQSWMIESLCTPVFEDFLKYGLLAGGLTLDSRDPRKFTAGKWAPRGWAWVDPLKDAQASILSIGARLKSRGQIVAEEGLDWEEIAEEISGEEEFAEEIDLDLTLPGATKPMGGQVDQSQEDGEGGGSTELADDADSKKSFDETGLRIREAPALVPSPRKKRGPKK